MTSPHPPSGAPQPLAPLSLSHPHCHPVTPAPHLLLPPCSKPTSPRFLHPSRSDEYPYMFALHSQATETVQAAGKAAWLLLPCPCSPSSTWQQL
jgi:hypothetical protein